MTKKHIQDFAVIADGRCDLNGLPCLRALNLVRQMARASGSLDHALPADFSVEAYVDIAECLRPCRLTMSVAGGCVSVSREGAPLASVDMTVLSFDRCCVDGGMPFAAIGRRAH
jgi:hypothetical protein